MANAEPVHRSTFKRGSRTYFTSSRFFPESVKRDVAMLYGFVRVADDFVDATPQDGAGFHAFVGRYRAMRSDAAAGDPIIDSFGELMERRRFDPAWVDAFLRSMEMDLTRRSYDTTEELLEYVYGSAEVIGLFMSRILELPDAALPAARMLGRAMQHINFIRDLEEDLKLGRRYLPIDESGLDRLDFGEASRRPETFRRFMRLEIARYRAWQEQAEHGFSFIPTAFLIPIKTASDMYRWTAERIEREPFVVFRRKVKPSKLLIVVRAVANRRALNNPEARDPARCAAREIG